MYKIINAIYDSLLWSLLIAILCFNNSWLQMRINTGYVFFLSWLLLTIMMLTWYYYHSEHSILTIINAIVCFLVALTVEGWTNLQVVPAALIREGLNVETLPFVIVNIVLAITLLGGLLINIIKILRK